MNDASRVAQGVKNTHDPLISLIHSRNRDAPRSPARGGTARSDAALLSQILSVKVTTVSLPGLGVATIGL
jgi:hypothetical protein